MKTIIFIESDKDDAKVFQEVFNQSKTIDCKLLIEDNAEEVFQLLSNGVIEVDLLVLDMSQRKINTHRLLKKIKDDLKADCPYILVMGESIAESSVESAYREGADCYLIKPEITSRYKEIIYHLENYLVEKNKFQQSLI
ncbi:Response regulator of citrate/malate metabolism [Piscirickettsia salmonis]|uniref:response regulator n=1 Tax=Piscirickettsia salmonis TaxID=1238 RepID=UPI0012BB0387|nr:response regulator [Piscirickettsia salmonis]QGP54090.1 Response regulator of citrate/malate metabolism [Piscirickettsia salmonis]QGP60014.1 Response regulator of citrate/malate metabolism [Piscirickettsia salmonis]QGP63667.1 Response regulator of citrate/malate metabolism [Piscirickettsia salmonis]